MKIVVFAPHQDDESFACAGTIAKHVKISGDDVVLVMMTDGRLGFNPRIEGKYTEDQLASIREKELLNAAKAMGLREEQVVQFRYHDQDLGNPSHHDEVIEKIMDVLDNADIVYLAITNFRHQDHHNMYFLVFETLEKIKFDKEIRVGTPVPIIALRGGKPKQHKNKFDHIDTVFPVVEQKLKIDISGVYQEKINAILSHESQLNMFYNLVDPKDDFKEGLTTIFTELYGNKVELFEVRKIV
ncbi:MAG: PIG-L deacetylase family protein [Candidatus Hodarchaeota archaeon]